MGLYIMGFGGAGCEVARELTDMMSRNVNDTFYVNDEGEVSELLVKVDPFKSPEQLEEEGVGELKQLNSISSEDEVVVLLTPVTICANLLMVILEKCQEAKITVNLILPDKSGLGKRRVLQYKVITNILQEFARSGMLYELAIFSNMKVETLIGEWSLKNYYPKINKFIANAIYAKYYFSNSQKIFGKIREPEVVSRISSFSVKDIRDGTEASLFDLTLPRDMMYYYGLSTKDAESKEVSERLLEQVRQAKEKNPLTNISYAFYEITGDTSYCYKIARTNIIQEIN